MGEAQRPDVTYVGEVLNGIEQNLAQLQALVLRRVLPQGRGALVVQIRAAHTHLQQVRELLDRAKLSNRLGFIRENGEVQPVMASASEPVNDAE